MLGILITVVGIIILVYGILVTFGVIKTDISKDPKIDRELFSEKSRYFLGRYNAGVQLMVGGLGCILLGLIIYFA